MRIVYKTIFAVLFFIVYPAYNFAQVIHSTTYSVSEGLSQSNVTSLVRDEKGFLWIGTQDGLNRFDGYNFTSFKHNPSDTNSLSNNFINDVIQARSGELWIATNFGLNRYDPLKDQYTLFLASDSGSTIPENQILHLFQDKNGHIWIKSVHYLTRYEPSTGRFTSYQHFNDYFNYYDGTNNFDMLVDHTGKLWVGTKDGLNYFNRELEVFKRYHHQPSSPGSLTNNMVQAVYEDKKGRLWVGTDDGLNLLDRDQGTFRHFYVSRGARNRDRNSINDILVDQEGLFWVATNAGLFLFHPDKGTFTRPHHLIGQYAELANANITELEQYRSRVIWVGTLQGMTKLQKNLKDFKLYRNNQQNEPLFVDNLIASVYKDRESLVWVGTWDEGLFLFNRRKDKINRYTQEHPLIPSNDIHTLFADSKSRLWIGTDNGVVWFDLENRTFHPFSDIVAPETFANNRVYAMDEGRGGTMWFATRNGLHAYNGASLKSYYSRQYDTTSLTSNFVYDVMVDSKGSVWAATNKGLNHYLGENQGFRRFQRESLTCSNCLVSNETLCLHEDHQGNIWIGTVGGLNKYDPDSGVMTTYTEQDGLPNNLIYAIQEDRSGNLWISSNKGLTKMDVVTGRMINYGIHDGLQDYEFNHLAACQADDGEMFFGGISGLNAFYPDSIQQSNYVPNIEITSAEVITNKTKKNHHLLGSDTLMLPAGNNLVTIEFVSLDMVAPNKTQYAYKLQGAENEWVDVGNRRYATFSNLDPGKYDLMVRATNNDQVWNNSPEKLTLIVATPMWQTRWAITGYGVLGMLIILGIIRWRTNNLRKANQRLKEREIIARQVARQKEELSIKNKNITDSLTYAKRIQESLLPSDNTFKSLLSDSFILYKPKDIVSGDFYWVNEVDDKLFIAVVDCTGHGVPGAFMSIIGVELLNSITNEQGVTEADNILYDLNKGISLTLSKDNNRNKTIRDGMDIALCVIDKTNRELEFAGAFRPIYLIRDNKIEEIRGDRFSVGMMEESMGKEAISKRRFKLRDDDMVYLFTDGYADQFGGPDGKKFKYRRFRHLLLNIHQLPLEQQRMYLNKSLEDWQGDQEQVDDILIVGFTPRYI